MNRKTMEDPERGTLTRAKSMPTADRRWRIKILIALTCIFLIQFLSAWLIHVDTIRNRGVGNGNRVVQCATLERVAPTLRLPECAAGR